jgi:hypothetical protein
MPRLTLFAKGNSDLTESLFLCPDATAPWNGLNEALRSERPAWRVRLQHETLTRSDALLAATGTVPPDVVPLDLGWPYDAASQFSAGFFDAEADVYLLSIQPDVTTTLLRHRRSGAVFFPGSARNRSPASRDWLRSECEPVPALSPDEALEHWLAIVGRLRRKTRAPILFYNLSSVVPGEQVESYRGLADSLSTRIKRFNLALIALSERSDAIVVDVDRLVAHGGADRLKLDSVRLTCEGNRLVAQEVLRILEAYDCFSIA